MKCFLWIFFLLGSFASGLAASESSSAVAQIAAIERQLGGRVGVFMLSSDWGEGGAVAYRADERFPMCSTFKLLLAADVLQRVDSGAESLSRIISYRQADLISHSPVTEAHLAAGGLSVEQLCAAAVEESDNGAANLLLQAVGGPAGLTRFLRSIGDPSTRLDRNEPELNSAIPGDPRDTSTPAAFARDVQRLVLGTTLSASSRQLLTDWLKRCATGAKRIRAGLPAGCGCGDKTGTGSHNSVNDIAVVWPPKGPPVVVSVFCVGSSRTTEEIEAAMARIGAMVAGVGR